MKKYKNSNKIKIFDPKYNSFFIAKFVNKFVKNGKKNKIYNVLYNVFKKLKRIFNFNIIAFLKNFIKKNKPLVFSKTILAYNNTFHIPKFLLESQKKIKVLQWIVNLIKNRKEKTFFLKVFYEFVTLLNSENPGFYFKDKNITILKNLEKNKKLSHYRW